MIKIPPENLIIFSGYTGKIPFEGTVPKFRYTEINTLVIRPAPTIFIHFPLNKRKQVL